MPESTNIPAPRGEDRTPPHTLGPYSTDPAPADIAARAALSPPGDALPEVAGYDVSGVLGRGGMGVIYRATQQSLNRPVALKMILGDAVGAVDRARFVNE